MSFDRHGALGKDDLSWFWLRRGTCSVCGRRAVVLRYRRATAADRGAFLAQSLVIYHGMTWGDLLSNPSSILRHSFGARDARGRLRASRAHGALGVTCGCYGRFQRQIAHIASSIDARATRAPRA